MVKRRPRGFIDPPPVYKPPNDVDTFIGLKLGEDTLARLRSQLRGKKANLDAVFGRPEPALAAGIERASKRRLSSTVFRHVKPSVAEAWRLFLNGEIEEFLDKDVRVIRYFAQYIWDNAEPDTLPFPFQHYWDNGAFHFLLPGLASWMRPYRPKWRAPKIEPNGQYAFEDFFYEDVLAIPDPGTSHD